MSEGTKALQPNQLIEQGCYKQVKVSVDPAIAVAFKDACAAVDASMAAVLSQYMADYSGIKVERYPSSSPDYTTRKKRRRAIHRMVKQLIQIKAYEEEYRDRIPENLQGSSLYDQADELTALLEEVIDSLATV